MTYMRRRELDGRQLIVVHGMTQLRLFIELHSWFRSKPESNAHTFRYGIHVDFNCLLKCISLMLSLHESASCLTFAFQLTRLVNGNRSTDEENDE